MDDNLVGEKVFQHTAARRRLRYSCFGAIVFWASFNTQPRGGGCLRIAYLFWLQYQCFNTQPRGGGCFLFIFTILIDNSVSTHSRAEAAARPAERRAIKKEVSTHSRAEAAAILRYTPCLFLSCFNTQPRGGGCLIVKLGYLQKWLVSTHSRAEAAALSD